MDEKTAILIIQQVNELGLSLKGAYGKRLSDSRSTNPYIIAARAKMEAYLEVIEIIKRGTND